MNEIFVILLYILMFFLGASIGSFLSVLTYRMPRGEDWVKSHSHCPNCKHNLTVLDLFPVFSQLFLRSKCRYCGNRISLRYIFLELFSGASYVLALYSTLQISEYNIHFNALQLLIPLVLFPTLIAISLFDIETGEIPDGSNLLIAALGVIVLIASFIDPALLDVNNADWQSHLIGAFIISVPFLVLCFFGGMGMGDVKLVAAAGLLLGWSIVPAAFIAVVTGSIAGVIIKYSGKSDKVTLNDEAVHNVQSTEVSEQPETAELTEKRTETATEQTFTVFKFGPYLAVGIIIGYLWGYDIILWYQSLVTV